MSREGPGQRAMSRRRRASAVSAELLLENRLVIGTVGHTIRGRPHPTPIAEAGARKLLPPVVEGREHLVGDLAGAGVRRDLPAGVPLEDLDAGRVGGVPVVTYEAVLEPDPHGLEIVGAGQVEFGPPGLLLLAVPTLEPFSSPRSFSSSARCVSSIAVSLRAPPLLRRGAWPRAHRAGVPRPRRRVGVPRVALPLAQAFLSPRERCIHRSVHAGFGGRRGPGGGAGLRVDGHGARRPERDHTLRVAVGGRPPPERLEHQSLGEWHSARTTGHVDGSEHASAATPASRIVSRSIDDGGPQRRRVRGPQARRASRGRRARGSE